MPEPCAGLVILIEKGPKRFVALATLVYDGNGQPFAENIQSSDPTLLPLPQRLALDPAQLELIYDPQSVHPAVYKHRTVLIVP